MKFRRTCLGAILLAALTLRHGLAAAPEVRIERAGNDWVIDTGVVRKVVQVEGGRVLLSSFRNLVSAREYAGPTLISPELRITVEGTSVSGGDGGWTLVSGEIRQLKLGQRQLDLKLRRAPLEVTKHYVAYPGAGIIREWITIRNISAKPIRIEEPHFLLCNLLRNQIADLDLYYVTGGGNYNGSQLLKQERLRSGYRKVFDSKIGIQTSSYSAYLPLLVLRNRRKNDGVMAGWDYMGHWSLEVSDRGERGLELAMKVAGYTKALQPGEEIETPKAFAGAFSGDIDALGNALLDWQYEHMWEYTNDAYFARTRWAVDWPDPWVGEGGTPSGDNWGRRLALDLRYIDLMRETGTEILWDDAGWYDKWGSWQGPDWRLTTDLLAKHGMRWVLWYPTFLATRNSRIGQRHPEWLAPGKPHFEQAIRDTAEWQYQLLSRNVKEWGDFQWRYDIAPAVSAGDTGYLQSDRNFRWLVEKFKSGHPNSGVDACYGGGRWISYDLARLAESGEYTDGGVGPYSSYYTSLIVPPDKYHNVVDYDHTYYRPSSDRIHLAMNPTWYRDPGDGPDLEAIRKDWDLYRYLRSHQVVGRWSHVFRPDVSGDDPIWYFQRMNRDSSKGVIITKHARTGPVYFVLAQRIRGGAHDSYFGAPWNMCTVATSDAAKVDTGVYQDPIDAGHRFYGTANEVYGPVNFLFRGGGGEASYVRSIVKRGGVQPVSDRFFGMAIQTAEKPLVITALGLNGAGRNAWQSDANEGVYRLSIMKAGDRKALATVEIDMAKGHADRLGFKYAKLGTPVQLDPAPGPPVIVRPHGLQPGLVYRVHCSRSGYRGARSGADLMDRGITLGAVQPGELIFLNLPGRPGAGADTTPPSTPVRATKRIGNNLGFQGVEVRWDAATDDNWISYYEVLRDGAHQARAAIGTFYFDHSSQASVDSKYEVRAVDGDGNPSRSVTAEPAPGGPETYRALGGFSPRQGERLWRYEEAIEEGVFGEMQWEHAGYEGRWHGSGLARIGRIYMQAGAHSDVARVFVVPAKGTLSIGGPIRKDPSAENGRTAKVRVLLNKTRIWPSSSEWVEVDPDSEKRTDCRIGPFAVNAGDRVRFVAGRTGEQTPEPIVWDPVLVLNRTHGDR